MPGPFGPAVVAAAGALHGGARGDSWLPGFLIMSFGLGNVFVGVQTAVVGLGAANTRGEPTPEITGIAVSEPATHPARLVLKLDMD